MRFLNLDENDCLTPASLRYLGSLDEAMKTSRALTYRPSVRRFHPWSEIIHRQQPWWRRLLAKVHRW